MRSADRAEKLLGELRVHEGTDGPVYGVVKAIAAVGYGLLAVAERLEPARELETVDDGRPRG